MKGAVLFTQSQKLGLKIMAGLLAVAIGILFVVRTFEPTGNETFQPVEAVQLFEMPELPQATLLKFDINHADSADWAQLPGIGKVLSARIVRYRTAIGGFSSVDDLASVYSLSAEVLENIRPQLYVDSATIPQTSFESRNPTPFKTGFQGPPIDINTATADELARLPGIGTVLSQRIIKFRDSRNGYTSVEELRDVYQLSPEVYEDIKAHLVISPYPIVETASISGEAQPMLTRGGGPNLRENALRGPEIPANLPRSAAMAAGSVNINTADSALLDQVPGIGPVLSKRILRYKKMLGFYTSVDQLQNVYGLSEGNFQQMKSFLSVGDIESYPRRNLNEAFSRSLALYPFMDQDLAESLIRYRRDLGRFDTWEEVEQVPGLTEEALTGLKQYYHL